MQAGLRRITFRTWVLDDPLPHLSRASARLWLARLEDVLLQLHEKRGMAEVVFRLQDAENGHLVTANIAALYDALSRLARCGILQVVRAECEDVLTRK